MRARQTSLWEGAKAPPQSHANRGMAFEDALADVHEIYRARGLALISKQFIPALPVKDGTWAKVIGRATVDYTGLLKGGGFVAFDAKDCAGKRIELSRLAAHQQTYLSDVNALGGTAFVLVRFEARRVYAVPIRVWDLAVCARTYGAEGRFGDWHATGMASLGEGEMLPEWAVEHYDWVRTIEGWTTK